jgi:hypothetical protein
LNSSLDDALPFIFSKIKAFAAFFVFLMFMPMNGLSAWKEVTIQGLELSLHKVKTIE